MGQLQVLPDLVGQAEQLLLTLKEASRATFTDLTSRSLEEIESIGLRAITDARTSILMIATGPLPSTAVRSAFRDVLAAAAASGCDVRLQVGSIESDVPEQRTNIESLLDAGVKVSLSGVNHVMLLVVDNQMACLRPTRIDTFGAAVTEPRLVASLSNVAEALWATGYDARDLPPAVSSLCTMSFEQRRKVLDMLSSGRKDAVAARLLRLSPRTYHRQVAAVFEELGAQSRFQAGVLAQKRGWLTEPRQSAETSNGNRT